MKDPLVLVPPVGRRSRTRASAVSGVLEKCLSKTLASIVFLSAEVLTLVSFTEWKKGSLLILYHGHRTGVARWKEAIIPTVPVRFPWILQWSTDWGAYCSAEAATSHRAWQAVASSHGCRVPGKLALGRTRRLGPRDSTHCDSFFLYI